MAIAGKVMPRPRGEYDPTVLYDILDMVTYNNKVWMSKTSNNLSITPTEQHNVEWMLLIDGGLAVNEEGVLEIESDNGSYAIKDSSGINAFVKKNTDATTVELGISDDADTVQQISVKSATEDINDAVQLERGVNGETTSYVMHGKHNKPNGSYMGDGGTGVRTIDVGGIGMVLIVTSDVGMVLVSNRGGIGMNRQTGQLYGIPSYKVRFNAELDDGVRRLYVDNDGTNDLLNKADQQYWYQVL